MSVELTSDCSVIDRELDSRFDQHGSELSERARQHLQECQRCKKLYEWITQESPPGEASPELSGRIQGMLQSSLKPVSPRPSTRVLAVRFLSVFLLFAAPAIGMMGVAGLHQMGLPQMIGITVVLALGVALLSMSLSWQMTPGSLQRIPPKTAAPILTAGFLIGIAVLFPWRAPEAFLTTGWPCLKAGLMMALPAAVLFWLLVRRGVALNIGALGATLGAIAGLLSATVLQFTCSLQEAGHLLVWHGGVLVASTVLGVAIARLVNRLSREPA
ncbi:MAG: DUF1109 family protein [Acidobacteria bacterium]|nr:DUF1109 family protein [Acidobacteriota bacterium]